MKRLFSAFCVASAILMTTPSALAAEPAAVYTQHCASCHGADRLGGTGPALLPENLERLRKPEALKVIANSRAASQMPAFGDKLSAADIQVVADFIYTRPASVPAWGLNEIRATRIEHYKAGSLPDKPAFKADLLNLFVVVETGDHHATLLDGDTFEPIHRFQTRFALHGGPKFSPDGRYVYFASRDGWISRFDIWNLKTTHEIRAGINTRNLAVSGDGRYVIVGNYLPHTLLILNATDLSPLKLIEARDDNGKSSRVSAVYDAAPRKSFIAALKDIKEVWEIPYTDDHEPIYPGLVHDFRLAESLADKQLFPIRSIPLENYLDDFYFDQSYTHLMGASREGGKGQVINLDARRKIADLDLPGMPHLGSGITWTYQGRPVMATPNLKSGVISIIDMKTWQVIKRIDTLGPGFFMRSHENTPYAWTDNFMSPAKDTLTIIDKRSLEIVRNLTPEPGKTAAHVEFTRDGRYVLVSIWEMDGALIVYDAATFKEVKRIPMSRPSGKYNVYNKTTRSAGTSH
ncbi:nitrite reductase [Thiobacillus denitrificans]|uniref:Cytochrome Cbb3 n=1 Tax=Thiobacillus denitrificans TaxID=36861 RepID=A0A106BMB3_THIDE|nr:nitrite reductase [Thiobacillus denitrificans]KVW95095.1 cytochrome Cbb3 [Thiobacillus denitrificans]